MIQTPIIWNITNKCFYSCSFCCINANSSASDISLEDKLKIVNNLDSNSIIIDVSGGDPLINLENFEIIKILAKKFGRNAISITTTGRGLERIGLDELKKYVSTVGFTYDFPTEPSLDRPLGYNVHNLQLADEASTQGIETIAQIPLMKSNIDLPIIEAIYSNLHKAHIQRLQLIRFSKSGRGISRKELSINQKEIKESLRSYKRLESRYKIPRVQISPFVRGELLGRILTSLNISNQGLLLSNPWSYSLNGEPDSFFILGNLTQYKLSNLAGANVYQRFYTQLKRNIFK